jgi:DNA-binding transcriptional ArsR family regulator
VTCRNVHVYSYSGEPDLGLMAVPVYQAKADFFRTLGHPARIRILELLADRNYAVHELLEVIEIEPSNLSHQLAVLRRDGLVAQHREGSEVVYSISVPELRDLLVSARMILLKRLSDQDELKAQLTPIRRARR